MVVVAVIIVLLLGVVIMSFRAPTRTATYMAAQAAASTYSQAIEAYMADHGQTPPQLSTAQWPTATRAERIGGPRDAMPRTPDGQTKRYMPGTAPGAVEDGVVDLVGDGGTPSATARAVITYRATAGTYELRVQTVAEPGEQVLRCVITNAAAAPAGWTPCG